MRGKTETKVAAIVDDPYYASYFGDLHKSGISRVAFMWAFTTQPTVDDMKRLRDGLYGRGPFKRWAEMYPPQIELQRLVGLRAGLKEGATDDPGWATSQLGQDAGCPDKIDNLYIIDYDGLRAKMKELVEGGFEIDPGPDAQLLLRNFDHVSHMVIGTEVATLSATAGASSRRRSRTSIPQVQAAPQSAGYPPVQQLGHPQQPGP